MNPLLDAMRGKGGQARPREIYDAIAQGLNLSEWPGARGEQGGGLRRQKRPNVSGVLMTHRNAARPPVFAQPCYRGRTLRKEHAEAAHVPSSDLRGGNIPGRDASSARRFLNQTHFANSFQRSASSNLAMFSAITRWQSASQSTIRS
jgi:hypothetical protein